MPGFGGKGDDVKELGELVRGARQQKGVTLEQASAETRIRRPYLESIEDGDFKIFPGGAYATGFLRNYATYLGLNADEILQTYHALNPVIAITMAPATTVGMERLKRRSQRRMTWAIGSVAALIVAIFAVQKYDASQHPLGAPPKPSLQTSGGPGTHLIRQGQTHYDHTYRRFQQHKHGAIRVHALHTVWIRVKVDGHQVYWGPIHKGTVKRWTGHKVKLSTHRGEAIKVTADGRPMGRISGHRGRVQLVAKPNRLQKFK